MDFNPLGRNNYRTRIESKKEQKEWFGNYQYDSEEIY